MKTKMLTITMILTVLVMWTGGSAWAKNNGDRKHRQEARSHQNYDKRVHQRQENPGRQAHKYQNKFHGRHSYRPAPPAKRHYPRHHPPRRPVYRHKNHRHSHHGSGFLFGLSIHEPGQAFSIVLGDRH